MVVTVVSVDGRIPPNRSDIEADSHAALVVSCRQRRRFLRHCKNEIASFLVCFLCTGFLIQDSQCPSATKVEATFTGRQQS